MSWIDKLLDNLKIIFVDLYKDQINNPNIRVIDCDFDPYFDQQVKELEGSADQETLAPSAQSENFTPPSSSDAGADDAPPPIPGLIKCRYCWKDC